MNRSDFEKGWAPYEELMPFSEVWQLVESALEFCKQELVALLPSITFTATGRHINSILLTTADFVSEIHMDRPATEIDFMCLRTVGNYVVNYGTYELKRDGDDAEVFETASVMLVHKLPAINNPSTITRLHFVGRSRREWLSSVLRAIPVKLLIESLST